MDVQKEVIVEGQMDDEFSPLYHSYFLHSEISNSVNMEDKNIFIFIFN